MRLSAPGLSTSLVTYEPSIADIRFEEPVVDRGCHVLAGPRGTQDEPGVRGLPGTRGVLSVHNGLPELRDTLLLHGEVVPEHVELGRARFGDRLPHRLPVRELREERPLVLGDSDGRCVGRAPVVAGEPVRGVHVVAAPDEVGNRGPDVVEELPVARREPRHLLHFPDELEVGLNVPLDRRLA